VNAAFQDKLTRIRRVISIGVWSHLPPIVVIIAFFLASLIFLDGSGAQLSSSTSNAIGDFFRLLPILLWICAIVVPIWFFVTRSRYQNVMNALRWLKHRNWLEIFLLRLPLAILVIAPIGTIMLHFKTNIPNLAAYSWDHYFAEVDRALFFGYDPWVLSHMIFNHYELTKFIDNIYVVWFVVQQFGLLYIAFLPLRSRLRLTFLISFCLNWILGGVVLAIMLPAAGPVYMEALYGDPMFRPLTDLLHQQSRFVSLQALAIQELLWDGLTKPDVDPLGISAFPSLHVEAAVSFACLGFAVDRRVGWLLSVFSGFIFIGSVHLGWHYAIDGVAGVILAIVFWHIGARTAHWWLARTEPSSTAEIAAA